MNKVLVNILLVEDDSVDIMNVERMLKKNKIVNPLHIANNGEEALHLLRGSNGKQKIEPSKNIILLDIHMPKMNGMEFLKIFREDPELVHNRVFIMMGTDDDKRYVETYDHFISGYMTKPVSFEGFALAISVLHNSWQLLEQPSAT